MIVIDRLELCGREHSEVAVAALAVEKTSMSSKTSVRRLALVGQARRWMSSS